MLATFRVIHSSDELAEIWAEMRAESARVGRLLETGDAWVAATARLLNAPLLTHDRDFDVRSCPSITVYRHLP